MKNAKHIFFSVIRSSSYFPPTCIGSLWATESIWLSWKRCLQGNYNERFRLFPMFSFEPAESPQLISVRRAAGSWPLFLIYAQWGRTAKNWDVNTGPLAFPFARSLAPLTRLFASGCSLRSRPPLRSLVRALAPSLVGKWIIDVSKWPKFSPQWAIRTSPRLDFQFSTFPGLLTDIEFKAINDKCQHGLFHIRKLVLFRHKSVQWLQINLNLSHIP